MTTQTIVLKFGSSVLCSAANLPAAAHEIYRWYRDGWRVAVVVSALDAATEALLAEARSLSSDPDPNALAELLATGERRSAALMGIALDRIGVPARVVDPRDIGFTTSGAPLDAEPVSIDADRVQAYLDQHAVIVVPGFFGFDASARLQLLGRGGSDLTAVVLADALDAEHCRLLKDVDGVYDRDPAVAGRSAARRFATLSCEQAIECARQLIQPKAVRRLEQRNRKAAVAALARSYESLIGPLECTLAPPRRQTPLKVLMLGFGTVGSGVYERLSAAPEYFQVVAALVRDRRKHAARGAPEPLLIDTQDALAHLKVDVVVDALPGLEPSKSLVRYFLAHGVSVVSANKALICDAGPQLEQLAAGAGASLRYAAAVGGSAPMIEAVLREARAGEIVQIAGVLNGTSNYILARCAEGADFDQAIRAAQSAGFAEADPHEDLSGRDAARKLRILSRLAFGRAPDVVDIEPLDRQTLAAKRAALGPRESLRHIARAARSGERIAARVHLEAVPTDSSFGCTRDEWNRLLITRKDSTVAITGRGAGKWPTTEAVVGDLMNIARERSEERVDS